MDLAFAIEKRFWRSPDGRYWSEFQYPRSFWSRYLAVFDNVKILARVGDVQEVPPTWVRVDGDGVSFAPVPTFVGPWHFLLNALDVRSAIDRALGDESAILLRVPGTVGMVATVVMDKGRPYGVEVVGDPQGSIGANAVNHALPLRVFIRWLFTRALRRQCQEAACSLYVTEHALQRVYPPGKRSGSRFPQQANTDLSVGVSDVELPDSAFVPSEILESRVRDRTEAGAKKRFRIIFIGTLEVAYKAPDVLIAAFARCVQAGLDAELAMIGSGRQKHEFEELAANLGVADRVNFLGSVPAGEPVHQLDASDIFILPSRGGEGAPRALLEAMARGLPCIGTAVGGMPELLAPVAIVRPNDIGELTAKILQFARDPKLREEMARLNLATARRHHDDILQPKRIVFLEWLRDVTAEWQQRREAA